MPLSETLVMLTTVVVVVATHNLAVGVAAGTVLAMVLFARRVAHVTQVRREVVPAGAADGVGAADGSGAADGARGAVRYAVRGPLFFGSSNDLVEQFDYSADAVDAAPGCAVTVDLSAAQVWDASTVAALDAVQAKYAAHDLEVVFTGLDARSSDFHGRLTGTLN